MPVGEPLHAFCECMHFVFCACTCSSEVAVRAHGRGQRERSLIKTDRSNTQRSQDDSAAGSRGSLSPDPSLIRAPIKNSAASLLNRGREDNLLFPGLTSHSTRQGPRSIMSSSVFSTAGNKEQLAPCKERLYVFSFCKPHCHNFWLDRCKENGGAIQIST